MKIHGVVYMWLYLEQIEMYMFKIPQKIKVCSSVSQKISDLNNMQNEYCEYTFGQTVVENPDRELFTNLK